MTPVRVRIPPGAPPTKWAKPVSAIVIPLAAVPFTGLQSLIPSSLSTDLLLVLGLYLGLGGLYLLVVPLLLYVWMIKRWTVMGKLERLLVFGLVFLFFPGLILFAPFINLRMAGQGPT